MMPFPEISSELTALVAAQRQARPWADRPWRDTPRTPPISAGHPIDGSETSLPTVDGDGTTATVVQFAVRIGAAVRRRELDGLGREAYAALACGDLGEADVVLLDQVRAQRESDQAQKRQRWDRVYGPRPVAVRERGDKKNSSETEGYSDQLVLVRNLDRDAARRTVRRDVQGLGLLPPSVRRQLTAGQEAVAAIYAEHHMASGQCVDAKGVIAAQAGVCARVVHRAQDVLGANGVIKVTRRPVRGQRHQPTIVEIIDPEWRQWLAHRLIAKAQRAQLSRGVGDRPVCQTLQNLDAAGVLHDERANAGQSASQEGGNSGNSELAGSTVPNSTTPSAVKPTKEAIDLASEIAVIAGHGRDLPSTWKQADPPQVVQTWLSGLAPYLNYDSRRGPVWYVRLMVRDMMTRKKDGPPCSPRYFAPAIRKQIDEFDAWAAERRKPRKAAA